MNEILFADDDDAMRGVVQDVLEGDGFRVMLAANGDEALTLITRRPSLVITDLRMPGGGLDLVARLHAAEPQVPIILITAFGDSSIETRARELGAAAYFNKPVRMADLKMAIRRLLGPPSAQAQVLPPA